MLRGAGKTNSSGPARGPVGGAGTRPRWSDRSPQLTSRGTILRAILGQRRIEIALRRRAPVLRLLRAFGPVDWVAADLRGEMSNVDEFVRLAAQFIGHHGGLRRIRRND